MCDDRNKLRSLYRQKQSSNTIYDILDDESIDEEQTEPQYESWQHMMEMFSYANNHGNDPWYFQCPACCFRKDHEVCYKWISKELPISTPC